MMIAYLYINHYMHIFKDFCPRDLMNQISRNCKTACVILDRKEVNIFIEISKKTRWNVMLLYVCYKICSRMSPDYLIRNTHLSSRQQNLYVVAEAVATISHLNLWLFDFFFKFNNFTFIHPSKVFNSTNQQFQNWFKMKTTNHNQRNWEAENVIVRDLRVIVSVYKCKQMNAESQSFIGPSVFTILSANHRSGVVAIVAEIVIVIIVWISQKKKLGIKEQRYFVEC